MNNNPGKFTLPFYLSIATQFLTAMTFYMITPVLTMYLDSIGISLTFAGFISGLYTYTALVSRPLSGFIADRFSPKKIAIMFYILQGASVIGCGITTSAALFCVFRILTGLSSGFASTALMAYTCQFIPQQRTGEGMSYMGLGRVLASAVGPAVGSFMSSYFGYWTIFMIAGGGTIVAASIILAMPGGQVDATAPINEKRSFRLSDLVAPNVIPIACLAGLFSYTTGSISNYLLPFAQSHNIAGAAMYFTLFAVAAFVLRLFSGKIADKYGLPVVLITGFLCASIGVLLIGSARSLPPILLSTVFLAFGQGGAQPAIQAECIRILGPQKRGVAISTYYLLLDLVEGLAPTIGGKVSEMYSYSAIFYICAALLATGLILYSASLAVNSLRNRRK